MYIFYIIFLTFICVFDGHMKSLYHFMRCHWHLNAALYIVKLTAGFFLPLNSHGQGLRV